MPRRIKKPQFTYEVPKCFGNRLVELSKWIRSKTMVQTITGMTDNEDRFFVVCDSKIDFDEIIKAFMDSEKNQLPTWKRW